jgi:superfamily I DNA and RNA helicase
VILVTSNFIFLKDKWPNLAELAELAEENLYQDPNTTIIKLRMFTEQIVDYIFAYDNLEEPEENSFFNKLKLLEREDLIKNEIENIFHTLRIEGNKGVHESLDSLETAKTLLSLSHKLAVWFMQVYGNWKYEAEEFKLPSKENNENINLEVLENKYDNLIEEMQKEIDELKKNQDSSELENRKVKSEKSSSRLVFNAEEDEIIKINSDNSIEISSEYKFITTDTIDQAQKTYHEVWDSVRKAFSGRECIAYWRYPIFSKRGESNKEPDITIIDKELGVVVLEILNYEDEEILNAQYDRWDFADGRSYSPIYEVEDKLYEIKGLYMGNRKIRGIKETAAVILSKRDEKNWKNKNFDERKIIFKNHLSKQSFLNRIEEIETLEGNNSINNQAWNELLMVFTGQNTFSEKTGSNENTGKDGLIGRIFGKNKKKTRSEVKTKIKEDLFEVDMQQEVIGKTIPPGPQRIRGIAGSGKTVLLAQKAAHMHLKHPDWKIALVFFTRSLYDNVIQELNKWLKRFSSGEEKYNPKNNDKLQVLHAWGAKDQPGFYREICNIHNVKPLHAGRKKLIDGAPNEKLVHACKFLLEEVDEIKEVYDAVLIDEAQDLVVDKEEIKYEDKQPFYWLAYQSLKTIDENKDKRLVWAYDEAQSLNALNIPTAPQLFGDDPHFKRMVSGFHPGGIRKSEIMNKCYRTPGPILTAAHAVGMGLLRPDGMLRGYTTQEDWENIGYEVKEGSFNPVGQKVVLHRPKEMTPSRVPELWPEDIIKFNSYNTRKEELNNLAEKIKYNIEVDNLNPSRDILVIALGNNREAFQLKVEAAKRLKQEDIDIFIPKALKNNILYPKFPNVDPNKFWNDGAVTFTTTYRAKGNEAYMVYVIGLDKIAEDEADFALRNQLFVALSRTKGWLEVSGIGDFPMYEEFRNVIESGNTFEFTFQRPLADKRKKKEEKREIKVNDVVELNSGQRAKVIEKNNKQLIVKISSDETRVIKKDKCRFIREGKEVY